MSETTKLSASELWARALSDIKQEMSQQAFDTWFKPTRGTRFSRNILAVEVPDKFFKEWLIEHYSLLVESALNKILPDEKVSVEYSILEDGGLQKIKQPQEAATAAAAAAVAAAAKQAALEFNPKYTFDAFVVGPSNRFAHAASLAVAEAPARAYNPLFIYGGVGLGKTHLLHAIAQHMMKRSPNIKITYTSSEKFTNQLISSIQNRTASRFRELYRNLDVLLIDDIHFIAGKEATQEEFFHTFNTLYDAHKQIVISSDKAPKEIAGLEERLVSRFGWGLVTDIQPPDLETRVAILKKKVTAYPVAVPDDCMFFIAERFKSNIRELEGALIRVVAYATITGNVVDISLIKTVLHDAVKEEEKRVSVDLIQKRVAEYFDLRLQDMKTKRRTNTIAYPRQIAMYLTRELTELSLPEIGENFGGRDHSTVIHAYEKIKRAVSEDQKTKNMVVKIKQLISG